MDRWIKVEDVESQRNMDKVIVEENGAEPGKPIFISVLAHKCTWKVTVHRWIKASTPSNGGHLFPRCIYGPID